MRENVAILGTSGSKELSLLEVLDHVVNKGVVIQGSIVISLAGVDLIYLGLNVVLTSVETALRYIEKDGATSTRGGNAGKG
ncbi:MAG: gas vesicle protein [Acidobacteriales bacterium]|nr:gas vesicle protein [Terriglobales bacterium]